MDPQQVKMDFEANGQRFSVDEGKNKDGNSDGLVRAQMEISIPPSLLKSIVDAENVMIHTAGSPSSSSERPSISAAIITPPQQMVSEESQSPPRPLPPPPCLAVKESDSATPVPPPPPPPPPSSMTTSDTTSLSAPPPPPPPAAAPPPPMASSDDSAPPQQAPSTTSDEATSSPSSPARPPPPPPPMVPGSPPPPPAPAAPESNPPPATSGLPPLPPAAPESNPPPATPGLPPLPPSAPGNAMPASLGPSPPPPPPTASGSIPPPPPPSSGGSVNAPPTPASGSIPPPPPVSSKGGAPAPAPPPPGQKGKGGAPPPPPVGGNGKLLKKSVSKLKRSSQMGCLYRQLKAKVEGSSSKGVPGKSPQKKGNKVGASTGNGKQGMADALAEMTKRSSYFQQIEEDVKKYSGAVREVKVALAAFQTTDMDELIKFHKYVESHLEKLTDETQVLARFEDFPGKKLEGLRMAGALYSKLDTIYKDLQNWKIEPPANDLLDRIENYFNKVTSRILQPIFIPLLTNREFPMKIKEDIDTLDRTKDDEIKKFKSQKIHFDFGILIRIKESMVDVSSSCMEMALKEKKESSSSKKSKNNKKTASSEKILWKAFQFAFRVYSFAGGQDERAENLTREIAQQIQAETLQ
ncbi:hypothetical protein L1887_37564 [Cichorium endivia]|nr:hypothetical protein L1887_37564 [Cichorium endivia]